MNPSTPSSSLDLPVDDPAPAGDRVGSTREPAGLHVLIAEDEPMIQRALARFLELRGHRVRLAASAQAALELAGRERLDAALVDVHMPGGGLSVIRSLSADPDFGGRLVLMTGGDPQDHVREVDPSVQFLPKPFSLTRLADFLEGRSPSSGPRDVA